MNNCNKKVLLINKIKSSKRKSSCSRYSRKSLINFLNSQIILFFMMDPFADQPIFFTKPFFVNPHLVCHVWQYSADSKRYRKIPIISIQ